MATPHFRHQLGLHSAQVAAPRGAFLTGLAGSRLPALALLLALAWPLAAHAQRKRSQDISRGRDGAVKSITVDNLPAYNNRFFRPGFYIAPSFSRFFIEQSASYIQQGNIAANSIISPSFAVGFIGDIRLGPLTTPFHLRFAPGVSFLTRRVEYESLTGTNDTLFTQEVSTTQLELPLLLKYQSLRRRNTRVYFIGGLKPSLTVGTRLSDPLRNQVRVSKQDLTIEYGFGLDLFYPLFKFGPELRFSHGLRNLLAPRGDGYTQRLQSLRTNTVTLYLNFE